MENQSARYHFMESYASFHWDSKDAGGLSVMVSLAPDSMIMALDRRLSFFYYIWYTCLLVLVHCFLNKIFFFSSGPQKANKSESFLTLEKHDVNVISNVL